MPVVVCLNRFSKDTQNEIDLVLRIAKENGAFDAVMSEHWEKGGAGAVALGKAVIEATKQKSDFKFLYDLNLPIEEKIRAIAQKIYCAADIQLSELAVKQIETFKKQVIYSNSVTLCTSFFKKKFFCKKNF